MENDANQRFANLLDEGNKRLGTTFFFYLLFVFSAFVISFSQALPSTEYFSLPIINIQMNKWNSVEVLVLLAILMNFRISCLHVYILFLQERLESRGEAFVSYPTIFSILELFLSIRKTGKMARLFAISLLTAIPVSLLIYAGVQRAEHRLDAGQPAFGVSWWIVFSASLVTLLLSYYIIWSRRSPTSSDG